jgi:hypothetical protein
MSMPRCSFWAILATSLAVPACAANGVSYSGASRPRVAHPLQLESGDHGPNGQERLGRLSAACTHIDVSDGLDSARSSDVSCSNEFLLAALRDRAAAAGGTTLVGTSCDPEVDQGQRNLECSAEVWGPSDPKHAAIAEPLPVNVDPRGPAAPLAPGYGRVGEAWRVLIDYWPAKGGKPRAAVAPAQVVEVVFPRVGQVGLGDLRARAEEGVAEDTLRSALRAAAARIGATSIVGVRCVAGEGKQMCVASVAAPEVEADADLVAEAR